MWALTTVVSEAEVRSIIFVCLFGCFVCLFVCLCGICDALLLPRQVGDASLSVQDRERAQATKARPFPLPSLAAQTNLQQTRPGPPL